MDRAQTQFDEHLRNITDILQVKFPDVKFDDIPHEGANFLLFMCSLVFGMIWITYITFYNSRIFGKIATKVAARFVVGGHLKIGSLSWSVLPGKIMFRDVSFVTTDYTFRVQDGYVIFRWWRAYVPKDVSEDLSHSDARVSMQLNGFELHVYNRTGVYRDLEKKFGLEPRFFSGENPDEESEENKDEPSDEETSNSRSSYILGKKWRDLIPVIKVDLTSAKLVFGNKLLPTTLVLSTEEAHCMYSTKPAVCHLDHFMHFLKAKMENFRVMLAPSPKYTGMRDEAPRFMGEGFVLVATNELNLYYYMDEAGVVPLKHESDDADHPDPEWGIDIRSGKATSFSYGPWADRQREHIYKFFFPQDFCPLKRTPDPVPGDKREAECFRIRLSTEYESTMDVLFSKQKETNAIHMNLGPGTNFELELPWRIAEDGYVSKITGALLMLEATTSLPYRHLLQAETLEFKVDMKYPIMWNEHQEWIFSFTASKASINFVFVHKWFLQDLLDDWSSKSIPDLLYFVPYTWKFRFLMKKFEVMVPTNEYNWVDTSSTHQENSHLGLCGDLLDINFDLPFTEFLPQTVPFNFDFKGEQIDLVLFLPETNTSRNILCSMDKNAKIVTREGKWRWKHDGNESKWRSLCKYEDGWIDCWTAPKASLEILFEFHPMPTAGPTPQADLSTLEKEQLLLTPLRAPSSAKPPASKSAAAATPQQPAFCPDSLPVDKCVVKLAIDGSTAFLYGTLIKSFLHFKENLFGEDQHLVETNAGFADGQGLQQQPQVQRAGSSKNRAENDQRVDEGEEPFDPREHRPIEVVLDIRVTNLQAHLLKNCTIRDLPCPFLVAESLSFEMDKRYRETRLQLVLSPVVLRYGAISAKAAKAADTLSQGHLVLTGLQFRGNAMFSELGRPLGSDTLEYAWLIEIQCGSLLGNITGAQLYEVFICLEMFMFLAVDKENVLRHPRPFKLCQHNQSQKECSDSTLENMCSTEADLKYRMVRFLLDSIDVQIVEKASSLRLQSCPVRLSTCNLHGRSTMQGITAQVKEVRVQQYASSNYSVSRGDTDASHHQDIWIESGSVRVGPVIIEGAMSGQGSDHKDAQKLQNDFLQHHDEKTRRLWFLWPNSGVPAAGVGKCACNGGSHFFGVNSNGRDFFRPHRDDVAKRKNVALPLIGDREADPGFGQSLLRDGELACMPYSSFGLNLAQALPPTWPDACSEPAQLPFCPDLHTHKSSSSHNSNETPKRKRYHRSVSASKQLRNKPSSQQNLGPGDRSAFSTFERKRVTHKDGDETVVASASEAPRMAKTSSLVEVHNGGASGLFRRESLVSDVLSFYSADGDDSNSRMSFGLSSPKSLRSVEEPAGSLVSSSRYGSAVGGSTGGSMSHGVSSPSSIYFDANKALSSQSSTTGNYETATEGLTSPSMPYDTASEGRTSSTSFDTATIQAEVSGADLEEGTTFEDDSATLSHAASSNSFISAMSEHEELCLVNLHMQVNKPITQSPLLMASYISHLTQLRCSYWNEALPVWPHESKTQGRFLPSFDMMHSGLGVMKMRSRDAPVAEAASAPEQDGIVWDANDKAEEEDLVSGLADCSTSKSTVIVKFLDSVDLICCPILLESLEKTFNALEKSFQNLHPISVLNRLHAQSVDRVESKNTLKKEKSLDIQEKLIVEHKEPKPKSKSAKELENTDMFRTFEKSISSYVQASLTIPRINVMFVQASVVEEMCAFSALDHVKDITCVSLLAMGIEGTTFQFCKTSQSKKTVQIYLLNQRLLSRKKKKSKLKAAPDLRSMEPFMFESSEVQREEVLMTGSVDKIHAQLRRLRNDSSILQDAFITAIPSHESKVFFEYVNVPKLNDGRNSSPFDLEATVIKSDKDMETTLGYNMCECGFEGISIKVAKRSGNQDLLREAKEDSVHVENEVDGSPAKESDSSRNNASANADLDDGVSRGESEAGGNVDGEGHSQQFKSSTASGAAELQMTWFNFAAPPKTPISKKIDFTKLDWNLLSTVSPSIEAWLGPIDRLQEALSHSLNEYHLRVAAVLASLMAEALDGAAQNAPKINKHEKLTTLSRTLRDDPSCQLCTVLLWYIMRSNLSEVESNLDPRVVPPLNLLRQGIVVLSRQWKNALYTPILIEYNLRSRNLKSIYATQMGFDPITQESFDVGKGEDDDDESESEFDEEALLLKSQRPNASVQDLPASVLARLSPAYFSPISDDHFLKRYSDKRLSVGSDDSQDFFQSGPSEAMPSGEASPTPEESLYDWMKRQQQQQHPSAFVIKDDKGLMDQIGAANAADVTSAAAESSINKSGEEATPQTKAMHLLDAHIIFEPLLSSLGLMPQQIQNLSLKNLGYNVSILGTISQVRIDIIESEVGKRAKVRGGAKRDPSFRHLSEMDKSPAFLCEGVFLQVDLKRVTDITLHERGKEKVLPLYMTRAQLKRHTSSLVNFSLDVQFISQKVNMPLLRLLNQIATMHQNVRETNEELMREKKPEESDVAKEFTKQHKKSSSGSSTSSSVSAKHTDLDSVQVVTAPSSKRVTLTPSPSMALRTTPASSLQTRNRPMSFAQKFRPNSRLASMSYNQAAESPVRDIQDSFILTSAPLEMISEEQNLVACWKTMYNLLELYSIMPTTKTVQRHSLTPMASAPADASFSLRGAKSAETPTAPRDTLIRMSEPEVFKTPASEQPTKKHKEVSFAKADMTARPEQVPLVVFGIAKIHRTKLMAMLSGLKLEAEITGLQTSVQYRERIKAPMRAVVEASVVGNMQETCVLLLEGIMPKQQTVVQVRIGKSNLIHTSHMWKMKDRNSGTMSIELVHIEIPQHPVDLHGIVTRGTRELSSTLQEFRGTRLLHRGRTLAGDEFDHLLHNQSPKIPKREQAMGEASASASRPEAAPAQDASSAAAAAQPSGEKSTLIKPFVMQFNIIMKKLVMSAALLPSLMAEYSMENVTSKGMTGGKAKFIVDLPKHTLSFNTKIQDVDMSEANLPSEASIDLPKVQVVAEYVQDEGKGKSEDGSVLSQGGYLSASAEIGELEHSLTTDLLNHLVFVQKVFMKEVNEVVQKMSGSDRPVPVWTEWGELELRSADRRPMLFAVVVRLKNITVTATTPAHTGVRFETGLSEFHISNRVQNTRGSTPGKSRLFTKAKLNIKLCLGQLIHDPIYFEAEPQFQQQAYFKTTIQLHNAFQGEPSSSNASEDTDVIFITLDRPLIFVQPIAIDRAILFWLSYKNAWEYWTEQRLNLNKEVLKATEQVLEKVPLSQLTSQLSAQHIGTIFLQLNVQDIGLCIPLNDPLNATKQDYQYDTMCAVVATVESSSISACSARATVSKGKFQQLCIRFTDDFNQFLDDWKPDLSDPVLMNFCHVSQGSYEICSNTQKAAKEENAKWLLNISWQMTGVDVHVDTNIGKHLSALGHTMTTLTGEDEDIGVTDTHSISEDDDFDFSSSDDLSVLKKHQKHSDVDLPAFLFDPSLDKAVVAKYLEHEINEQAKTVEDLQKLGASESTVAPEIRKLNELQSIASKNFRQDLVEKLRRQKSKASYFKEKFGLGAGGATGAVPTSAHSARTYNKSKSLCMPSPTLDGPVGDFASAGKRRASQDIGSDVDRAGLETRASTIDEEDEEELSLLPPFSPNLSLLEAKRNNLSPKSSIHPPSNVSSVKPQEPNVDFEFHVNILINSGKCVLHTVKDEERRKMKKDRSYSGGLSGANNESPVLSRKLRSSDFKTVHSSTRLRDFKIGGIYQDITTFFIPGLDVRVQYLSKTDESNPLDSSHGKADAFWSLPLPKKASSKKAVLTAWTTLQSIPEETIISPTILEFLEQALEPIPIFNTARDSHQEPGVDDDGASNGPDSNSSSQAALAAPTAYTSFPVDVIVYFHMQSSTFRFSCLPISRVECMLRLPSLDLVFSSKRADGEINEEFGETTFATDNSSSRSDDGSLIGGLSITGCLNDFSLYVFHPYGGGRKQRPEEMNFSPLTSEERKDSLSVNVASVRFHISRSRKLNPGKFSVECNPRSARMVNAESIACVRFSTIVDIGSASFKYDMRRLSEILAFPKAWYRRTLVRRLFLGELKTMSFHAEDKRQAAPPAAGQTHEAGQNPARGAVGAKPVLNAANRRTSVAQVENQAKIWIGQTTAHSWETLVMIAFKFKELNVHMNMGNVMGNVDWISKDFRSSARLSIASSGHKNMHIDLGLNGSRFDAKAGIVGGSINLGRINTYCQLKEDNGIEPFHKLVVQLDVIEVRFDYMGTSVLMARLSHLNASINDDWHVTDLRDAHSMQPAQIFVQGDLCWDQLQVLISKSTTADLIKIWSKLEEFFSQQFKSSKKLFSSLEPAPWSRSAGKRPRKDSAGAGDLQLGVSHHRHWQSALRKISGMKIYTLPFKLPEFGSVLGGVLELRGRHSSLACFHGINFKSKSWALFSLKDPSVSFVSDAQDVLEEVEVAGEEGKALRRNTTVIQTLSLSLGQANQTAKAQHGHMATVKKISRSVNYLPPVREIDGWFSYAFCSSELDEVDRFPTLSGLGGAHDREREASDKAAAQQRIEDIFALPCMRMDLKTRHVQKDNEPRKDEDKPVVDCTFVTDFDNHIHVTTDAEAFFFLHDLITSYLREKDRVLSIQQSDKTAATSPGASSAASTNANASKAKVDPLQNDWRHFECLSWHLEPTVRLISWGGSEIEPYGVDYILQRLGFSHARTTIPKWLQRGCMDPLDKVLSAIMLRTIQMVQEEKQREEAQEKRKK